MSIEKSDMANRTVMTPGISIPLNNGCMVGNRSPGTYERGIFCDFMLPGIAIGVLSFDFNTNPSQTPHDPIYVCS